LLGTFLSGNVIPHIWWKKILFKNGKPAYTAITLLADLVYWYTPTEIRDETSGKSLGYRKKFQADAVQRSYSQFKEVYGFTKRQTRMAAEILEELNLIKRDPRNFVVKGTSLNNVMYWLINVEEIKKFTYTDDTIVTRTLPHSNTHVTMPLPASNDVYRNYTDNTYDPSSEGKEEESVLEQIIEIPQKNNSSKYTLYECLQYFNKPADERLIPDSHATTWMLHHVIGSDPDENFTRYAKLSKELRNKYKHVQTNRTADLIYILYNSDSMWWQYETWNGKQGHTPNEGTIKKTIEFGYKWHKENTIT
jgi:hypothetical protein